MEESTATTQVIPTNDSECLKLFHTSILAMTDVDTEQVAMALSLGCYYGVRRARKRESLVECYNGALKDMIKSLESQDEKEDS